MPSLTQKGQVTIPKKVRIALGLKPGDEVDFDMNDSKVVVIKKPKKLPFEKWRGCLGKYKTNELMGKIR
ncbi:AbrB/MazE/SpoVT family DNA-binding domain-containing protein [Candidatus Woesearchaeota archaeon]|nr:AbrB/MazE/SpoVT family DNA-binding domain-containing protein [Candidatus Woesearchaeota archaeon]